MEHKEIKIGNFVKMNNIFDKNSFLRYTVSYIQFSEHEIKVKVKEYIYLNRRFGICLKVNEIINQSFDKIHDANRSFEKLCKDYHDVVIMFDKGEVKAEDIFKDSVNYHMINPDCCMNCVFSKIQERRTFPESFHRVCCNRNNVETYDELTKRCPPKRRYTHVRYFEKPYPEVEDFGVCKEYKRITSANMNDCDVFKYEFKDDDDWKRINEQNDWNIITELEDIFTPIKEK